MTQTDNNTEIDGMEREDMEEPTKAGQYLAYEREKRGFTIEDIARQVYLPSHVIRSLEEDAYDKLPELVYVRGYIRLYCRLLRIDPTPVLDMYTENLPEQRDHLLEDLSLSSPVNEQQQRMIMIWGSVAVVTIFLILIISWWQESQPLSVSVNEPLILEDEPAAQSATPPKQEEAQSVVGTEIVPTQPVSPPLLEAIEGKIEKAIENDNTPDETSPVDDEAFSDTDAETSPVDDEAFSDTDAETSPVDDEAFSDTDAGTSPVDAETFNDTDNQTSPVDAEVFSDTDDQTSPVDDETSNDVDNVVESSEADNGQSDTAIDTLQPITLVVMASGESWVRIKDGSGETIVHRILSADYNKIFMVKLPLKFELGNAYEMGIMIGGKDYDFSSYIKPNRTAIFEVTELP